MKTSTAAKADGVQAPRRETASAELARLIREQRDDQRQDLTGLRRTVLGDCLRGIGVRLVDERPPRSRLPNMDEQ